MWGCVCKKKNYNMEKKKYALSSDFCDGETIDSARVKEDDNK